MNFMCLTALCHRSMQYVLPARLCSLYGITAGPVANAERTVTLLAFEDASQSPLADLMDVTQRQKTASELNAAILSSQCQVGSSNSLPCSCKHVLQQCLHKVHTCLGAFTAYPPAVLACPRRPAKHIKPPMGRPQWAAGKHEYECTYVHLLVSVWDAVHLVSNTMAWCLPLLH